MPPLPQRVNRLFAFAFRLYPCIWGLAAVFRPLLKPNIVPFGAGCRGRLQPILPLRRNSPAESGKPWLARDNQTKKKPDESPQWEITFALKTASSLGRATGGRSISIKLASEWTEGQKRGEKPADFDI
jgi:hypothetical protein